MSFNNCTEAYEAGYSHIPKSSPQYAAKLDRDRDGIACDNPPAGFKPRQDAEPTETSGAKGNGGQSTGGGSSSTSTGAKPTLPTTGPGEVTAVGGLLVLVGVVAAMAVRRRKTRFTA